MSAHVKSSGRIVNGCMKVSAKKKTPEANAAERRLAAPLLPGRMEFHRQEEALHHGPQSPAPPQENPGGGVSKRQLRTEEEKAAQPEPSKSARAKVASLVSVLAISSWSRFES